MAKVEVGYLEDVAVISIEGEVDGENFADITDAFTVAFLKRMSKIVVDMSKVSYINSQAISGFLSLNSKVADVAGKLTLVGLGGQVAKIFDMLRLGEVFSISASRDEALKKMKD
jgi:anti-anti-sigma factor